MSTDRNGLDRERAPLLKNAALPDPAGDGRPPNARSSVTIDGENINGGTFHGSHSARDEPVRRNLLLVHFSFRPVEWNYLFLISR